MKFHKNIKREVRELLKEQLKEYESAITMTKAERRQLHEWVASGRSPYDNGSYLSDCTGSPMGFVSALRFEKDLLEWFEDLSEEEKTARLDAAVQYDTCADDIYFNISELGVSQELSEEVPF